MIELFVAIAFGAANPVAADPFAAYQTALDQRDRDAAADALVAVLDDDKAKDAHGLAWMKLGDLLADDQWSLPYSALLAWSHALDTDPKGAAPALDKALRAAEFWGDEALLEPVFARHLDLPADAAQRSHLALLAARHHVRKDDLGAALGVLYMVDNTTPTFARSELLRGIVLSNQGKHGDALAPLVTAHALASVDPDLQDTVELNVARAYFGTENWGQAIAWYAKVDRSSRQWPEAQFERAWAHFRADDMQGTIGVLHTLQSPFYGGWNWAEADLLRTYAFYLLCKFPEATARINAFETAYKPVVADLDAMLQTLDANAAFEAAKRASQGEMAALPASVGRTFSWEQRFLNAVKAEARAENEAGTVARRPSRPWTAKIGALLEERRKALRDEEGQRVVDQAKKTSAELHDMLSGIEITRLDLLNYETQMYERAAATGTLDLGDRIGKLRKIRQKRGSYVWPFEGEYWEDELGWYVVDARSDCPESMAEKP